MVLLFFKTMVILSLKLIAILITILYQLTKSKAIFEIPGLQAKSKAIFEIPGLQVFNSQICKSQ